MPLLAVSVFHIAMAAVVFEEEIVKTVFIALLTVLLAPSLAASQDCIDQDRRLLE